jgi:hypothetical protein
VSTLLVLGVGGEKPRATSLEVAGQIGITSMHDVPIWRRIAERAPNENFGKLCN